MIATVNKVELLSEDNLYKAFKYFDYDNGGSITVDEISEKLFYGQGIDKSLLEHIFKEVDLDGSGEIEYDEFCKMMEKLVI